MATNLVLPVADGKCDRGEWQQQRQGAAVHDRHEYDSEGLRSNEEDMLEEGQISSQSKAIASPPPL